MKSKILYGDCFNELLLLESESVDMVITDPPYGINYKSAMQNYDNRKKHIKKDRQEYFQKIVNDDEVPVKWLSECFRILKNNAAMYCFCHWSKWSLLYNAVISAGFDVKNMIIMNKSNHGMGDLKGQFAPKHEILLFATKGKHKLNFTDGRMPDIWNVGVMYSGSKRRHPNEKPVDWHELPILCSSNPGDIILDPFCGSGSALVAAEKHGRRYIGIEIDKEHFDVAQSRLDILSKSDIFNSD